MYSPAALHVPVFDEYSEKYKCCCGCMHVRVGAITVGVILVIAGVLATGVSMINFNDVVGGSSIVMGILEVLMGIFLIVGVAMERPAYIRTAMIQVMVYIALRTIYALFIVIYRFVDFQGFSNTIYGSSYNFLGSQVAVINMVVWSQAIGSAINIAFCIWFFFVMRGARDYVMDKLRFATAAPLPQFVQQPMPVGGQVAYISPDQLYPQPNQPGQPTTQAPKAPYPT